jgi:hypothetical protein
MPPNPAVRVTMNFMDDLRDILAAQLIAEGFEVKPDDDVDTLLVRHINIVHRRLPVRPRRVEYSRELRQRLDTLSVEQREAIERIEASSARGEDLNPYLSRKIVGKKKRGDFNDRLLCDWDTHHMHLGLTRDPDGKVTGTEEVLFVVARHDVLRFVTVLGHEWTDESIFNTITSNWPELAAPFVMKGVVGLERDISEAEREELRAAGINVPTVGPDGRVYVSLGGGISTDGSSTRVRREADRVLDEVENYERLCRERAADLAQTISAQVGRPIDELRLRLVARGEKLAVMETQTSFEVRFGS